MLRGFGIAGLALAAGIAAAAAQDMKSPRISLVHVEWDAVAAELKTTDAVEPTAAPELMARLNGATGERFANIAASPVPVLLPFDAAAFLRDRAAAAKTAETEPAAAAVAPGGNHLFGFGAVPFFYPGPAGYDAVVTVRAQDMPEFEDRLFQPDLHPYRGLRARLRDR
jgi:hypothetical protein